MNQEQMDRIRMVILDALRDMSQVEEVLFAPDEGDTLYATINGEEFALTVQPI